MFWCRIRLRIRRSLVKLWGLVESVTQIVTGCLRMTKAAIFIVLEKDTLVKYGKYGALSLYWKKYILFLLNNFFFHSSTSYSKGICFLIISLPAYYSHLEFNIVANLVLYLDLQNSTAHDIWNVFFSSKTSTKNILYCMKAIP